MTGAEGGPPGGRSCYYLAGMGWLLLAALALWAYYTGSAPFDTLGIAASQLVLGAIFIWIGWRRASLKP